MPTLSLNLGDVTQAIQLALAPVFLLTGIAGLLNVMAGRLSRIIDRGRTLTEHEPPPALRDPSLLERELRTLDLRRYLASAAITACTLSALLVCLVIGGLFLEVLLQTSVKWLIGLIFTASTLALVVGLAFFLREVHLATRTIRIWSSPRSRIEP